MSEVVSLSSVTSATSVVVGGLVPLSTVDFPDRLSAVVFCQGCPWRCEYCHNPHLLPANVEPALPWSEVRDFLERRRGLLDAVVFTGGEPTRQPGLVAALADVRALGYQTALHTGGCYPSRLEPMLPLLDWIAMDIKAPFDRYQDVTGIAGSGAKAKASIEKILAAGVACEFHATAGPSLLQPGRLLALAEALAELGVRHFILQQCRDPRGLALPMPNDLIDPVRPLFASLQLRRCG
ncbi:MAG: anaerobic ribonucleoside-triphosphate reductase activating protein [Gammaproteobacteria bacterium]|nr:anaerobic ribonucleoside-triphosphate reductase activating protein [Gammaproteobacteria bacterium]